MRQLSCGSRCRPKSFRLSGRGGFDALYDRSVFLIQAQYPWLADGSVAQPEVQRLARLKARLEGQNAALALDANNLLLITFTDVLAGLVGEPLTVRILYSAWGHDAQQGDAQRDAQQRDGKEIEK